MTKKKSYSLREQAELLLHQSPEKIGEMSSKDVEILVHELQVHQIELEIQNEDLRNSQQVIEHTKNRYIQLFDSAPVGYVIVDSLGRVKEFNTTFLKMVGESFEERQPRVFDFLHPEDSKAFQSRFKAILKNPLNKHMDARIQRPDKTMVDVIINTMCQDPGPEETDGKPDLFLTVTDVTRLKESQARLSRSVAEKEALLRELYHRTKNNMQMILSLINLQIRDENNPEVVSRLGEIKHRIVSMSLVHEQLCNIGQLDRINLAEYLEALINRLMADNMMAQKNISLTKKLEPVVLDIDSATSCGLIVNELMTNIARHAFIRNESGHVDMRLTQAPDSRICLIFKDDGTGLPESLDLDHPASLGLFIVKSLVESKLEGSVDFQSSNGTCVEIGFYPPEE